MTKTIIITGGAGFVGSHLCNYLIITNKVICIDNLITGNMDNISHLLKNPNFTFINHDVTQKFDIMADEIYHLAGIASPEKYKKYPLETMNVTIQGTLNVLELCVKYKSKLLFTSTSEIYGDPLIHPQTEEYWGNVNTVGDRSCYDESKRVAETYINEYRKIYNLDLKIVRIFNTYGPKMNLDDGRVITNFIKACINKSPLLIYGDGTQTRSFCYIDDLIDGLAKMMKSEIHGPINLGNPNCEFTLNQLALLFVDILDRKLEINYLPLSNDDPKQRKPDISKAVKFLDWSPKINLVDGICKTYYFFDQNQAIRHPCRLPIQ